MGYQFKSRVRYSEIDEDGKLTLPAILNYFQDCCTFHSEDVGLGMKKLRKIHRGWVLSSWQIIVERYPEHGEELTVETWPYDFKGFMGMRNFILRTSQGESLCKANTLWSFMNTDSGMPVKLQPENTQGYKLEPKLEMEYAPRKIGLLSQGEKRESFLVQKHHLDTNHHVNNSQYITMATEYLPKDFEIWQMRAEYKMQARLGERILPWVSEEPGRCVVSLNQETGKPYAIVEFSKREK